MRFSLSRAMIIARREYSTTVRRPQFLFSLLFTPAILMLVTFVTGKLQGDSIRKHQHEAKVMAIVDSAGVYTNAPSTFAYVMPINAPAFPTGKKAPKVDNSVSARTVPLVLRRYSDQKVALDSLNAGNVTQVVTVSQDFLATGNLRMYQKSQQLFSSAGDDRAVRHWLTRYLIANSVDSVRADRVLELGRSMDLYTPTRTGEYAIKDDARELVSFFLPFILGLFLATSIITGGQYMLQGLSEEKETRILESMLTTVTPDDLMLGKLVGLGAVGLTMVGAWAALGLYTGSGILAFAHIDVPPTLALFAFVYFLLGYTFYGSLMTGIGAIANNLREAQQFAMTFTILNFIPFWLLTPILSEPNGKLAVVMSLFPPSAPSTMLMRMSACSTLGLTIPVWQVATSLGLLAVFAAGALMLSARIFRIGLLLYGKTPNLPEILKLMRKD